MNSKKVLMLGWEFPPFFNGGLGIACYQIANALKSHVQLSIILPKVENESFADIELIGLNTLEKEKLQEEIQIESYSFLEEIDTVQTNITPYETIEESILEGKIVTIKRTFIKKLTNTYDVLDDEDLYGNNLLEKVKRFAEKVVLIAQEKEFDVIYAHDWMTFLAGIELQKKTQKPLVLHVHSLEYDRTGNTQGWVFDLEKYALSQANHVITVSDYTKNIALTYYQVDAQKIEVVHNGVEELKPITFEKRPFPEKLVVFLGRITSQKGPLHFLDIASKVLEKYPKLRFVMAGAGDEMKKVIETGASRELGDRFHLTGFLTREKVNYILSLADVYCMPSVSEPFGLSAVEAAQMKVPIVISKQSGVAEVLTSALKADNDDTDGMVKHILSLLTNQLLATQQAEKGYQEIKELRWNRVGDRISTIFQTL